MSWTSFDCFKYVQFASCVQVVSSYRTRKNNSIFMTEFKNKVHDRKSLYGVTLKTWSTSVFTDNIWTTFFVSLINFSVFPLLQNHPSQIIVFKGYGGRDFNIGEILFPGTTIYNYGVWVYGQRIYKIVTKLLFFSFLQLSEISFTVHINNSQTHILNSFMTKAVIV